MRFDKEKFKKLVHYIIWTCPDKAKLGSVKMHKILWKSDTEHYSLHGTPITGARYIKRQWGPAANALLSARDELAAEGMIKFWRDSKFAGGYSKDVYEALRSSSASFLSLDERKIVDYWTKHICLEHTATSISEETHGYAWEIAEVGEELPMVTALVERGRDPVGEELEWAEEEARKRGLV
jgi:hypothetical protein